MKNEDWILLGGGVIAAYIIFRTLRQPAAAAAGSTGNDYVNRITKADGWEYYTDGTAIAPNGDYYHQGELVWRAAP